MTYTFGDTPEASQRLERLASLYEIETRGQLKCARPIFHGRGVKLAVDLGCGPGWTTALIDSMLSPARTVGLDRSEAYIQEASTRLPYLEFLPHDVLAAPYPVTGANLLFCRFLLTHLQEPVAALRAWQQMAAPGALLMLHETESLSSDDPTLTRYYQMVEQMQSHYGQQLNIGPMLDGYVSESGWKTLQSEGLAVFKPADKMAELHRSNLRTWSQNDYARQAFDPAEVASLDAALDEIASGRQEAPPVRNVARQIVAQLA